MLLFVCSFLGLGAAGLKGLDLQPIPLPLEWLEVTDSSRLLPSMTASPRWGDILPMVSQIFDDSRGMVRFRNSRIYSSCSMDMSSRDYRFSCLTHLLCSLLLCLSVFFFFCPSLTCLSQSQFLLSLLIFFLVSLPSSPCVPFTNPSHDYPPNSFPISLSPCPTKSLLRSSPSTTPAGSLSVPNTFRLLIPFKSWSLLTISFLSSSFPSLFPAN